jgi:hypothetical protein
MPTRTTPAHYRGTYTTRSRKVRADAWANPGHRCWRCGYTYAEFARIHGKAAAKWESGHVDDGNSTAPLRAEHHLCNRSAGGRVGGLLRQAQREPHSQRW